MTRTPIRQGDILLVPIAKKNVPKNLVEVPRDKRGRLVLAEGEVTGHAHCILDDAATLFRQVDMDELADAFLRIEAEVAVQHDEHSTLRPEFTGRSEEWWAVRRKREYQPEEIVRVSD